MLPSKWTEVLGELGIEFQWAPTLGGECYPLCTMLSTMLTSPLDILFQWAPTLGGECYRYPIETLFQVQSSFNGHPPLGVNATMQITYEASTMQPGFNGHPPLGVNATGAARSREGCANAGGFNGHPPLGVNATDSKRLAKPLWG